MNLLDTDPTAPWQSEAYYLAARRRVVEQMGTTEITLIEINAGGQLLPHVQSYRTVYCCIGGEGDYTLNEQEHELQWGAIVEVAPHTIHAFTATGTSPLYLFCFQSLTDEVIEAKNWLKVWGKLTGRLS